MPTSVESYSASLAAYLEAARHGTLDAEIIDRPIADLDAVKAESDSGTITIAFLPEQWETLVGIVAGHTRTLAEANQLELSSLPEPECAGRHHHRASPLPRSPTRTIQPSVASHAAHRALMQMPTAAQVDRPQLAPFEPERNGLGDARKS